jgi:hypothetical protein
MYVCTVSLANSVLTTITIGDKILIRKDGILRKQSPSGEKSMDHNDSSYE